MGKTGTAIGVDYTMQRMRTKQPHWLAGKQAVLFDAGFTLLEPTVDIPDVYLNAATHLGVRPPEAEFRERLTKLWATLNRDYRSRHADLISSEELERQAWHRFTEELARPFPDLLAVHPRWLGLLFDHFDSANAWKPCPGAVELLEWLSQQSIVVGVVSNWHSSLHAILEGHDLRRHCRFVMTSAEAGRKKPHPEIFAAAVRSAGVLPAECVYVGDSWSEDIEGALAVGISPVYVARKPPPSTNAAVLAVVRLTELWLNEPMR